jgi:multiple sugar transport system permease protein
MAVAQVWKVLYNGNFGLINQFLRVVGVDDPPYWIVTPGFAIVILLFVAIVTVIQFIGQKKWVNYV